MSLPQNYNNVEYFRDVVNFLKRYQWMYNYPNTHILVQNVFDYFPNDWVAYLKSLSLEEFNNFPLGVSKESCPESLSDFFKEIDTFKIRTRQNVDPCDYIFKNNSCLGSKKKHEIIHLASLVSKVCQNNNVNSIIDIGCGLGYLSHLLFEKYNYQILGIEGSDRIYNLALKNQEKHHPKAKSSVKFVKHYVTPQSLLDMSSLIKEHLGASVCITGLHVCADLSIIILNIFAEIQSARCLVIMPCCYHRLEVNHEDDNKMIFTNFPASDALRTVFTDLGAIAFLRRPFLRLACQQTIGSFTKMSKTEHDVHSKNLLFRAVLELVAHEENCTVVRTKRKSGRSQAESCIIEHFIENLPHTHKFKYKMTGEVIDLEDTLIREKILEKWKQHEDQCELMEILTGFQAALQSVCENMLLLDRINLLEEKGIHCYVEKVVDDDISPRCHALVAMKEKC